MCAWCWKSASTAPCPMCCVAWMAAESQEHRCLSGECVVWFIRCDMYYVLCELVWSIKASKRIFHCIALYCMCFICKCLTRSLWSPKLSRALYDVFFVFLLLLAMRTVCFLPEAVREVCRRCTATRLICATETLKAWTFWVSYVMCDVCFKHVWLRNASYWF